MQKFIKTQRVVKFLQGRLSDSCNLYDKISKMADYERVLYYNRCDQPVLAWFHRQWAPFYSVWNALSAFYPTVDFFSMDFTQNQLLLSCL